MKSNRLFLFIACLGLSQLISGCITSSHTTYVDAERVKVSFANDRAGKLFYETLSKLPDFSQREETRSGVHLIVVNVDSREVKGGPNRNFNRAVELCDTDHDGVISEQEAEIFSNSWRTLIERSDLRMGKGL